MKKYIIYIAISIAGIVITSSCNNNFLNEKLYSSYAPETLADSLGIESSLSGLYYDLSLWYTYSGNQGWLCVWQAGTDIAYPAQPEGYEIPYTNYDKLISTDGAAEHTWQWAYKLISDANTIISTVHSEAVQESMGETGRREAEAEARFFRGYAYEKLVTFFGSVPLITEPVTGPKTDFVRPDIADVNAQIVNDLSFASEYLTDVNNMKENANGAMYERVNKAAAMQELAIAYLRIGKPDSALVQTQAIINSQNFQLIDQRYGVDQSVPGDFYHDMFIYGNQRRGQGNTEAIWVLEQENPNSVNGGISGSSQLRRAWQVSVHSMPGFILSDSTGGRGIGRMRLNNWVLYNLYDQGDIRNSRYNIKRHYYYNDPSYSKYGEVMKPGDGGSKRQDTLFKIGPETTKWFCFDPDDEFGYAAIKDIIIMRLGGTYLLQAEAQVQLKNYSGAAESINVLRKRAFANYPTQGKVTASEISGSGHEGMDFILDERARELLAEENRRETLMRTGLLYERVMGHIAPTEEASANILPYPIEGLTKDKAQYFPIPQNEIDLNKDAELNQNAGY